VAVHLCQAAANAGFDVIVADDRTSYATKDRFPAARETALDFDEAMKTLDPRESSYIVIVTRGHRDDMRILGWAVQTPARCGHDRTKGKVIEIFKTLRQEGIPEHLFEHVHAGRVGHRSDYTGGNCGGQYRGVDRGAAAREGCAATHELV
jgi:xanthine dehydrogenase accessory factor